MVMRRLAKTLEKRCSHLTVKGGRCKWAKARGSAFCELHVEIEKAARNPTGQTSNGRDPHIKQNRKIRKAQTTEQQQAYEEEVLDLDPSLTNQQKANRRNREELSAMGIPRGSSLTSIVLSEQARGVLKRLGAPLPEGSRLDPKVILLNSVRSAHEQQQLWESLLSSTPDDDFLHLGEVPLPGSPLGTKGARIEFIQKSLSDATKASARISKMAIDAGIEERLVRIAEEQSAIIADAIKVALIATLKGLHLSPAQEINAIDQALNAAATHLRELESGNVIQGDAVRIESKEAAAS